MALYKFRIIIIIIIIIILLHDVFIDDDRPGHKRVHYKIHFFVAGFVIFEPPGIFPQK